MGGIVGIQDTVEGSVLGSSSRYFPGMSVDRHPSPIRASSYIPILEESATTRRHTLIDGAGWAWVMIPGHSSLSTPEGNLYEPSVMAHVANDDPGIREEPCL